MGMDMMSAVASNASLANSQGLMGIKVLGMAMEDTAKLEGSMVAHLANMPPPVGVHEIGGLLDVRA